MLAGMSRQLEFEGAFWHITGNERKDIFRQDGDWLEFLSLLATAVKRFRWRLHEYWLTTDHCHLVIGGRTEGQRGQAADSRCDLSPCDPGKSCYHIQGLLSV